MGLLYEPVCVNYVREGLYNFDIIIARTSESPTTAEAGFVLVGGRDK